MPYVLVLKSVLGNARAADMLALNDSLEWVVWSVAVVAGVIVLVVALFSARRRLLRNDLTWMPEFTLDRLRTLRDRGDSSDDEYEALRLKMLDQHRGG